jgi:hypothetical protein
MQIIPFDSGNLPAHVRSRTEGKNASILSGLGGGGGYPVISIKGKVFAVVKSGERTVLKNPKDPDSAATSIEAVIVNANKGLAKVFYLKGYDPESSEKQKPDCYSTDGVAPASDAQNAQSKKCATCIHNQYGSAKQGKGKACSDTKRLAIAAVDQINEPMLLRIPPASLKSLGEYIKFLDNRDADFDQVVTKISFDMDAESPKLAFKALGFLDDKTARGVKEMADTDLVRDIVGGSMAVVHEELALADQKAIAQEIEEDEEIPKPTKKVVAEPVEEDEAPKKKVVAKKKPVVEDEEFDLDGINFDD